MNDQEIDDMFENVCPRCQCRFLHSDRSMDALSRRDNATYVCSPCGEDEAVLDLMCRIAPQDSPAPNVPGRRVYEYFRDMPWPRRGLLLTFDRVIYPAIKETQNG